MKSLFSDETRKLIYRLDTIPSESTIAIYSSNELRDIVENHIKACTKNYTIHGYDNFFCKDKNPAIIKAFSNDDLECYILIYPDGYNSMVLEKMSLSDVSHYTVLSSYATYKEYSLNNELTIKDKQVVIISSNYFNELNEKMEMKKYSSFITSIANIIARIFLDTDNRPMIYSHAVLPNQRICYSRLEYLYLVIAYYLYCKYCHDEILLKYFYDNIAELQLYDTYEDFKFENEQIKNFLN
jgi:hypothetical protein